MKRFFSVFIIITAIVCFSCIEKISAAQGVVFASADPAEVMLSSNGITWLPKISYAQLDIFISRPDGTVFHKTVESGKTPYADISEFSTGLCDGSYTYELRITPVGTKKIRSEESVENTLEQGQKTGFNLSQTGHFVIVGGSILDKTGIEGLSRAMDVVHADDAIITGSICVGFDCLTDGTESFVLDTIKLKENTLRIYFDDTSTSAGFPANDWRLVANDSSSGGGSYFSIEDSTNSKTPFKVEANAKTSSLYVSSTGRVGLGTSTPILNLHITYGDSPSLRFEQDGSSGWSSQTWDIVGNETNFFIRDVTGGSKLPIRIQPGTPTNTLTLRAAAGGDPYRVGIGTWAPEYPVEVETTGANAAIVCDRTDGAKNFISSTASYGQFGTVSSHPTRILVNSAWKMQFNSDNSVSMASGASCTAGGAWTDASSRALKENIQSLETDEALNTLNNLNPVKFNYKADKADKHVGFIAEDVPDLVASADRKGLSPMDVTAVLTKVLQEQQKILHEQQKSIKEQQKTIEELKAQIKSLEKK